MSQYLIKRILEVIPVLLGITLVTFLIFYFDPSDPVVILAGENPSPEAEARIRQRFGLDQPGHIQYGVFLTRILRGDVGHSYRSRQPVAIYLGPAIRATLYFTAVSLVLMILIGLPAGILSATRPYTLVDNVVMSSVLLGLSAPIFWIGILLMYLFAYQLRWLPSGGAYQWQGVILPSVTMGLHYGAIVARITRTSMLEVLRADYIRTARAKGIRDSIVFYKHALRNASLPIVTTIGLQVASMLGGTILVETVFSWPGIGRMMINAILERDAPIVQGGVLVTALAVVVLNVITDLFYVYLNPMVRYD